MRLLITRPERQAQELKAALVSTGHVVISSPLTHIVFESDIGDFTGFDAFFLTSVNALKALEAGGCIDDHILSKTVYAVGSRTVDQAYELGFESIVAGDGNVDCLLRKIEKTGVKPGQIWAYPSADIIRHNPEPRLNKLGVKLVRYIAYHSPAVEHLEDSVVDHIRAQKLDAVLFYSPRAVEILVTLCRSAKIDDALFHLPALCLSETIATVAKSHGFQRTYIAPSPNDDAMLQLVEEFGQEKNGQD